ncbi:type IV pilin protein [Coralloluteibacterium thermophilus]|uniref:Type IV pilin protein n=1 Tax=Coralloluteibacterium thermophilum TaxID=2707049 RepID=A0ABV9NKH1_9GAMM
MKTNRNSGFTLIELMIVVAVVAILAAIAIPSYQDSVRKGRRGQVKADLVEFSQLLERHHTTNNSYVGVNLPTHSPRTGTAFYRIDAAVTDHAFTLSAQPLAAGGQEKDRCGMLTLRNTGAKTAKGNDSSPATLQECW